MNGDDPTVLLILAILALAWRVLDVGELLRGRPWRPGRPWHARHLTLVAGEWVACVLPLGHEGGCEPERRPWGKGW